ncbi:MAG TPA: hypothetical protein VFO22_05320 [Candidatus Udaeobacter sp.]|nr:hypothetical protein [Candidatus Udaeobacter sp.]
MSQMERGRSLEEHVDPAEVNFSMNARVLGRLRQPSGEELSQNCNLPAGPTTKLNVLGFGLRRAPPI